jgi:hypothetical protein
MKSTKMEKVIREFKTPSGSIILNGYGKVDY